MFVASNQRRIPGNLYAVKKVVRSIHIDYKERKGDAILFLCTVCVSISVCVQTVTHNKLIIRVHFSLPHRSGVLETLNIIGLIEAKKQTSVRVGSTLQHSLSYSNPQQFTRLRYELFI